MRGLSAYFLTHLDKFETHLNWVGRRRVFFGGGDFRLSDWTFETAALVPLITETQQFNRRFGTLWCLGPNAFASDRLKQEQMSSVSRAIHRTEGH